MSFEIGKTYRMRNGDTAKVVKIKPSVVCIYPLGVLKDGDSEIHTCWHTPAGKFMLGEDSELDLLLPAIGPEGEVAGFSPPTVRAMRDLQDFWAHFRDSINAGIVDPTAGGDWPEWDEAAVISRTYPSKEAALSDCETVISGINSLLEGGAR